MAQEYMYDMYPYGSPEDNAPLTLRATLQEAAAKGWHLEDCDIRDATNVEVACRAEWQASQRPLSAQVAHLGSVVVEGTRG